MAWPQHVGIVGMEVYIPQTYVAHDDLERFDGASQGKYTIGLGQNGMAFCSDVEDINTLSLTVVQGIMERYEISYSDIGHLQVGTETLLDKSKSVKTVLMELFSCHGNTDIEGVDSLNACYGGTAALFNAANWVESSAWDGRYALVVAADIAVYASGNARPTGGAGAVAILVGPNAVLPLERGVRSSHMEHVYDFYKPDFDSEYPRVNGQLSIKCFLKALDMTYQGYKDKVFKKHGSKPDTSYFDFMTFHAPFSKLVQKAYARLNYHDYLQTTPSTNPQLEQFRSIPVEDTYMNKNLERAFMEQSKAEFGRRTAPSLLISRNTGNMYTATLYSCIASLFLSKPTEDLAGKRIGAFSYGSGLAATMFSFTVTSDLAKLTGFTAKLQHIKNDLDNRTKVDPMEFERLMKEREESHHKPNRTPKFSCNALRPGTYYIVKVDEEYRRTYARVPFPSNGSRNVSDDTTTRPSDASHCTMNYCRYM